MRKINEMLREWNNLEADFQREDFIKDMTHEEMAIMWRFGPVGSDMFDDEKPWHNLFAARFLNHFKGFNPTLSKKIGWKKLDWL